MDPASLLARHDLPTTGLQAVPYGTTADIWRTERHVLRIGAAIDHRRETCIARAALAAGVHTATPVAHGTGYSIWERVPGTPASHAPTIPTTTWSALLTDLERLHMTPPEPRPRTRRPRGGYPGPDSAAHESGLTGPSANEACCNDALGTRPTPPPPRLRTRRRLGSQCSRLPRAAATSASSTGAAPDGPRSKKKPHASKIQPSTTPSNDGRPHLDLPLLYALRLELLLTVALQGRGSPDDVRNTLSAFDRLRSRPPEYTVAARSPSPPPSRP